MYRETIGVKDHEWVLKVILLVTNKYYTGDEWCYR